MPGAGIRRAIASALVRSFYLVRGHDLSKTLRRFSESQWLSTEALKELQFLRLKMLLRDVHRRIPFYRSRFDAAGFHPDRLRDFEDLKRCPITTKEEIRAHFRSMSVSAWRRLWSVSPRRTSGSSGDPLLLFKDYGTQAAMDAVMFRNYGWFGIRPGDLQVRFWGCPGGIKGLKNRLKDFLLHRRRFSSFDISRETARGFLDDLRGIRSAHVYGYAQTVHQMASILAELGREVPEGKLEGVILTGEMVFPEERRLIERVFNARTINEYGCTELGIIAMECPEGGMHTMENLLVEIASRNGDADGEVLATELESGSFPLIRYRIGDVAALDERPCRCGRGMQVLSRLKGRADDWMVCPGGRAVDPYFFGSLIFELPPRYGAVHKFKIIQEDDDRFRFLIVTSDDFDRKGIEFLAGKTRKILGEGVRMAIERVQSIPREPSGKLCCFSRMPRN